MSEDHLRFERLWKWYIKQDEYVVQEFGIGVVGIGALFLAYASVASENASVISVSSPYIREMIALVGLGASLILWMHIFGSNKEKKEIRKLLKKYDKTFIAEFMEAQKWRGKGIYLFIYYPVTRLMGYFMELITWAWLTIIIFDHGVPLDTLVKINLFVITPVALIFAIVRRFMGIKDC